MQTEYYRSPCPQGPSPDQTISGKRRKWPALILFSSLAALLLAALIIVCITAPDKNSSLLDKLVPELDTSFHFEFSAEGIPDAFGDFFDWDDFFEGEIWPDEVPVPLPSNSVEKASLPRTETAPDVHMTLYAPKDDLSFYDIYNKTIPSIVSIEVAGPLGYGTGTGVIFTEDGYIVTNHHIIENCSEGMVILSDGREYPAMLVGSDVESDLAVLKIEATALCPAEFGDSGWVQVGDTVLAIGNPLGSELFGTMTNGIVSAINRNVNVDGYHMSLIQTTAALNPGNSGGALINTAGQVIGITNMKMMSTYETIEGLGFAIPSVLTKDVVDILLAQGKITGRPTMGITCLALLPGNASLYGQDSGIYVSSVLPGGPAEEAGLNPGDVILSANGQAVTTLDEMTLIRDQVGVGGTMELYIWRDGDYLELELLLVEQYELH